MNQKLIGRGGSNRSPGLAKLMEESLNKGVCPFCEIKNSGSVIVRDGTFWVAWWSAFPYSGHKAHLMLATKEHIGIEHMTPEMWTEWGEMNSSIIKEFDLPGGGIFMRFGDLKYNAGTLWHLHSHIQVPDRTIFAINVLYKDEHLSRFLQVDK